MALNQGKVKEGLVLEVEEGSLIPLGADSMNGKGMKEQYHGVEEQVSDLFGKLNLTAQEKEVLVLEDAEDPDLAVVNHAVIGKVLAHNPLQLQTIMAAMRPAWGNPKGLIARMVGDNLFIAEFESAADKNRILDGSPWYIGRQSVGRQVVILKDFNYDLRPTDVSFDELAIWVNILNLPLGLRNEKWGFELAGKIGKKVLKVDVDEQKRAVGKDLRARVIISLKDPIPRGVSVFSSRRQRKEWYDVVYERLPFFCFSCGIIGHSEIECPKPASRDENGCLPYSEKLRAPEEKRLKNQSEWFGLDGSPSRKNNSSETRESSDSRKSSTKKSDDRDKNFRKDFGVGSGFEASSPVRNPALNDTYMTANDMSLFDYSVHGQQFPAHTKKRKSDENLMENGAKVDEDAMDMLEAKSLSLVPAVKGCFASQYTSESGASESSKKLKNENAGLLEQPRVQK